MLETDSPHRWKRKTQPVEAVGGGRKRVCSPDLSGFPGV